jgi:PsbP-like protein
MKPFPLFVATLSIATLAVFTPIALANHTSDTVSQRLSTKERAVNTSQFSLHYPDHWIISSVSGDYIIIYNQEPPQIGGGEAPLYMIKTDASISPESFENFPYPSRGGTQKTIRVQNLTIDGQEALRIWYENDGDFQNTIVTYIRLNNFETASIASYYSVENQAAEAAIEAVHDSFKLFR